ESAGTVPGLFTIETGQLGGGHSLVTYNALGHEVARGTRNHDGSFSYVETSYKSSSDGQIPAGLRSTVTRPHAYHAATVQTSFEYDPIGRPWKTTLPDASTVTVTYNGLATTVTDPRGYARTTVRDEQGRAVRVDEDSQLNPAYDWKTPYARPGTAISTNYEYGPFSVLNEVSVTARDVNGGDTTVLDMMRYDPLGRRISLVDSDSAESVTSYNAFGEVTSEGDANGKFHIPARDALGRIIAD